MSRYRSRPLGDGLELDVHHVSIQGERAYDIAGVYSFGRGLFSRASITAADTKYQTLNELRVGQFVLSRLKAFEGAVAVVAPKFAGHFLSQEFPTFTCIEGELEPTYLECICHWPGFWSLLAGKSRGIGSRRERVHPDRLLEINVPMPTVDEQRRIADRLTQTRARVEQLKDCLKLDNAESILGMLPAMVDRTFSRFTSGTACVADVADFVSDSVPRGSDPYPAEVFVGPNHIESHTGRLLGSDPLGADLGPKLRFQPGDVIYQRLRPYLNKVWVADRHGLCSIHQAVLRAKSGCDPKVIGYALRSRSALNCAIKVTPTQHLPEIRASDLAKMALLTDGKPNSALTEQLDHSTHAIARTFTMRRRQMQTAAALFPSFLNEEFGTAASAVDARFVAHL